MANTVVFPAAGTPRPAATLLNISKKEKLRFTLITTTPAPLFDFSVNAVNQWDPGSAPHTSTAIQTTYTWDFTSVFTTQFQDLFLKVMILANETYRYIIEKVDAANQSTKLIE